MSDLCPFFRDGHPKSREEGSGLVSRVGRPVPRLPSVLVSRISSTHLGPGPRPDLGEVSGQKKGERGVGIVGVAVLSR